MWWFCSNIDDNSPIITCLQFHYHFCLRFSSCSSSVSSTGFLNINKPVGVFMLVSSRQDDVYVFPEKSGKEVTKLLRSAHSSELSVYTGVKAESPFKSAHHQY